MLWRHGSPTREFLYVEDAAEGILLAADRYDGGEPVNVAGGREISIRLRDGILRTIAWYQAHRSLR